MILVVSNEIGNDEKDKMTPGKQGESRSNYQENEADERRGEVYNVPKILRSITK